MKSPKPRAPRGATPAKRKTPTRQPANEPILRLFVAGATARSSEAILRVRQLCETELKGRCHLEVIDIYQQPASARENQIVATPTLIIEFPPPRRRFIGNLTTLSGLFVGLDLDKGAKLIL